MNAEQAIERALQEPTLAKALVWIAVWETERVVAQALEWQRTGVRTASHGGAWETCFDHLFALVIERHADRVCPKGHVLLPQSQDEAFVMNVASERFLFPHRFESTAR